MKAKFFVPSMMMITLSITLVSGQIPNHGFENWIDAGTHLNPEGWWTPNDSVQNGSYFPVTRSTDHYPASIGDYSLRLENNVALYPDWASVGVAWTGEFSGNDNPVFPVTGHPTSLWGYFKFLPQNGDTMEMHVRLYLDGVDISGGSFKTAETVTEWTPFSLTFSEYTDADSARIFLSSCYDNDQPLPHGNSVLYLDNLSFDNLITGTDDYHSELMPEWSVFPNPVSDLLTVATDRPLQMTIFDGLGRRVMTATVTGTTMLDLSSLPNGLYFLKATTTDWRSYSEKIRVAR